MKKRTQIEAELAELAQQVSSKSNADAANAVLELYKEFALLAAEEHIQGQMEAIQEGDVACSLFPSGIFSGT